MIALLQRVTAASVEVDEKMISEINAGLLVLLGVEKADTTALADKLLEKILSYRIFADEDGKMNLGVLESGGGLIIVPQFTLAANTKKGLRPGFSTAAHPDTAREIYDHMTQRAATRISEFGTGQFGADMKVHLVNDGPATFWLQVSA